MDKRTLLLEFCEHMGLKPKEQLPVGPFREAIVDEFLAARGGALGFSEDELKSTARDECCSGYCGWDPVSGDPHTCPAMEGSMDPPARKPAHGGYPDAPAQDTRTREQIHADDQGGGSYV